MRIEKVKTWYGTKFAIVEDSTYLERVVRPLTKEQKQAIREAELAAKEAAKSKDKQKRKSKPKKPRVQYDFVERKTRNTVTYLKDGRITVAEFENSTAGYAEAKDVLASLQKQKYESLL